MVTCAFCTVNHIDTFCTNTPRMCFTCCAEHPTISTCPRHYRAMGVTAAAARKQANMVHPAAFVPAEPAGQEQKVDERKLDNADNADADNADNADADNADNAGQRRQDDPPQQPPGGPSSPRAANPPPPPPPHAPNANAASPLTLEALAAAVAAMQTTLLTLSQRWVPATPPPAPARPVAEPLLPRLPPPSPASEPPSLLPPPPAHRSAVLDRAAVASQHDIRALVNRIAALPDHDSDVDDDDAQVASHAHNHAAPVHSTSQQALPSAFIPPPVGTEKSASQQLEAIFTAINKQGGKVKYSSVEELNEALDDWFTDAVRSGRSAAQLNSIRAYQRLLITQFAISDRMPLKQLLEYHRLWCKGVHAGTIDMFAQGAAMNHDIYYTVTHPLRLGSHGSPGSSSQPRDGKSKTPADTPRAPKQPKVVHPAGSCTYHPESTSHLTANCNNKGKAK